MYDKKADNFSGRNKMLENTSTELLRDLEIRVASLEREALFGFNLKDMGVGIVKEKITEFLSKIPYFREIERFFKQIFKGIRDFGDAKKRAKEVLDFGKRNKEAKKYLDLVYKEESSLKGRLKLILSHIKDSEARSSFMRSAADTLGQMFGYMLLAWAILEILSSICVKLGIVNYVLGFLGAGAIIFVVAFILLFMVDWRGAEKEISEIDAERKKREIPEGYEDLFDEYGDLLPGMTSELHRRQDEDRIKRERNNPFFRSATSQTANLKKRASFILDYCLSEEQKRANRVASRYLLS